MNVRISLTAAATCLAAVSLASDGLQPIGFSARQMAVGGAVTANPMTAATVFTNPAGLSYVPSGVEFSLAFANPNIHGKFVAANADAKSNKTFQLLPSVAISAPLKDERMKFGFAVGVTAGSGVELAWSTLGRSAFSDLQILRLAPAVSYKTSDKVSVGASLNVNIGRVSLANEGFGASGLPAAFGHGTEVIGLGGTLGVMADVSDNVRLGASYTTRTNFPDSEYPSAAGMYKGSFDFPQQAAIGVTVNQNKPLSFSADLKWIDYSQTLGSLYISGPGLGSGVDLGTKWKTQTVLALGAQYRLKNGITFMCGYNGCNTPFDQSNASKNLMLPATATSHFTLGAFTDTTANWNLGAVLVYQPSHTVSDGAVELSNSNTTIGIDATIKF